MKQNDSFLFKVSNYGPMAKLKIPKHQQIQIWTFLIVFNVSICWLSPRLGIVISKLVYFKISLAVTKSLIFVWSVQPWNMAKTEFRKLHEIKISTFLYVFSASKCRLSPRVVIVITKLVYFEISFAVTKWIILHWSVQLWTHG